MMSQNDFVAAEGKLFWHFIYSFPFRILLSRIQLSIFLASNIHVNKSLLHFELIINCIIRYHVIRYRNEHDTIANK